MFFAMDLEEMVPPEHPLRPLKKLVDERLATLGRVFNEAYAKLGRPSVPPERLLKAMLLQAIYSIRSERQLVERIRFDLLFRWFLDMDPAEDMFDATTFTRNRERMARHDLVRRFHDAVVHEAATRGLISHEHFTVDGTLVQSMASLRSLAPIDENGDFIDDDDADDSHGGTERPANFHGQKRSNATHRSTTDPEARLYSKCQGAAYLQHAAHVLSENRSGLIVDVSMSEANGRAEREQALALIDRVRSRHRLRPRTLGADKGYDAGDFLLALESRKIEPHVPTRDGPIVSRNEQADARRRARKLESRVRFKKSQFARRLREAVFAWMKPIAGMHRARHRERWKIEQCALVSAIGFNLIRMRSLMASA
jgi:transposase